jgi:HK97 family phage major capsid protein
LHPRDWLSVQLEKDSQGRYVFADAGSATMPMIWGLPVIPTPAQTLGRFTVIDSARYGYVADREVASVRISEKVND